MDRITELKALISEREKEIADLRERIREAEHTISPSDLVRLRKVEREMEGECTTEELIALLKQYPDREVLAGNYKLKIFEKQQITRERLRNGLLNSLSKRIGKLGNFKGELRKLENSSQKLE